MIKIMKIKKTMKSEYTYIGLSSEEDTDVLTKNIIDIIEVIKNKSNNNG